MKVSAERSSESHWSACGLPDGSVKLLRGAYDRDGEGQVLAQDLAQWHALGDLAGDPPRLTAKEEAHHPLGFLQRRDVPGRGLRGRNGPLPRSRNLSIGRRLAGSPSGVGSGVEQIGRSANYRAGEGIRTLDV